MLSRKKYILIDLKKLFKWACALKYVNTKELNMLSSNNYLRKVILDLFINDKNISYDDRKKTINTLKTSSSKIINDINIKFPLILNSETSMITRNPIDSIIINSINIIENALYILSENYNEYLKITNNLFYMIKNKKFFIDIILKSNSKNFSLFIAKNLLETDNEFLQELRSNTSQNLLNCSLPFLEKYNEIDGHNLKTNLYNLIQNKTFVSMSKITIINDYYELRVRRAD